MFFRHKPLLRNHKCTKKGPEIKKGHPGRRFYGRAERGICRKHKVKKWGNGNGREIKTVAHAG